MDFRVGVPAEPVSLIKPGTPATITLGALPDMKLAAEVSKVSPAVSSNTTYPVTLSIKGDLSKIRAGLDGEAAFKLSSSNSAVLTIPASCVASSPDGTSFVWVISAPGSATSGVNKTPVKIGGLAPDGQIEVLSGIEPGMTVVSRGVHSLSTDSIVALPQG